MNFEEAKETVKTAQVIFRAFISGSVWSAGATREIDETIGYYLTEEEAAAACEDRKLFDFDATRCATDIEKMSSEDFE